MKFNVVWLRNDLRWDDNPAFANSLSGAFSDGAPTLALFVFPEAFSTSKDLTATSTSTPTTIFTSAPTTDSMHSQDEELSRSHKKGVLPSQRPRLGRASEFWLSEHLKSLSKRLESLKIPLFTLRGDEGKIIKSLAESFPQSRFFWNRRYSPLDVSIDKELKTFLKNRNQFGASTNGTLLHEPWEIQNNSGSPYLVFTPYWKSVQKLSVSPILNAPFDTPSQLQSQFFTSSFENTDSEILKWAKPYKESSTEPKGWSLKLANYWRSYHQEPLTSLSFFLNEKLGIYKEKRNIPALPVTSGLSPFLRFGIVSPKQVWHAVLSHERASQVNELSEGAQCFLSELCWREFSHSSLFFQPDITSIPIKSSFNQFPWDPCETHFDAWKTGRTGYPIVDAGMRELWETGLMHNRVRMITASFLVKHLLIPWQRGEQWFWDTLVDACPANNPASWQWVTGCGLDAAPYFRIFNPMLQSEKFDPNGIYIKKWIPELGKLSSSHIHAPWLAPSTELLKAGVSLGKNYPYPLVDHSNARAKALASYQRIRGHDVPKSSDPTLFSE